MMIINFEERLRRQLPKDPINKPGGEDGPSTPKVNRPDTNELLKRMKRIDPEQAKRYRQRSGE